MQIFLFLRLAENPSPSCMMRSLTECGTDASNWRVEVLTLQPSSAPKFWKTSLRLSGQSPVSSSILVFPMPPLCFTKTVSSRFLTLILMVSALALVSFI